MAIEESKIYEESCTAFRHYSNAVMNIRMLVFAQGLAILTASGYFISSKDYVGIFLTCIFGMSFTIVLAMLQRNYYNHANNILNLILSIEEDGYGTWSVYAKGKDERNSSSIHKNLFVYAPYLLFLMAFIVVLIWGVVKAYS